MQRQPEDENDLMSNGQIPSEYARTNAIDGTISSSSSLPQQFSAEPGGGTSVQNAITRIQQPDHVSRRASDEKVSWSPQPIVDHLPNRRMRSTGSIPRTMIESTTTLTATMDTEDESIQRDFKGSTKEDLVDETTGKTQPCYNDDRGIVPTKGKVLLRQSSSPVASISSTSVDKVKSLPFPWKLHHLLEESLPNEIVNAAHELPHEEHNRKGQQTKQSSIISWMPNGTSFCIHDKEAFCNEVMPRYFRQSKFESFTRQLYIYGFSKIDESTSLIFAHPQFVRGNKEAVGQIGRNQGGGDRRRRRKERARRSSSSSTSTTNATAAVAMSTEDNPTIDDSRIGPNVAEGNEANPFSPTKRQRQDVRDRIPGLQLQQLQLEEQQRVLLRQQYLLQSMREGQYDPSTSLERSVLGSSGNAVGGTRDLYMGESASTGGRTMAGMQQYQQQDPSWFLLQQQQQHLDGHSNPHPESFPRALGIQGGIQSASFGTATIQQQVSTPTNVSSSAQLGTSQGWDLEPRPIEDMMAESRNWNASSSQGLEDEDHFAHRKK